MFVRIARESVELINLTFKEIESVVFTFARKMLKNVQNRCSFLDRLMGCRNLCKLNFYRGGPFKVRETLNGISLTATEKSPFRVGICFVSFARKMFKFVTF